MKDRKKITAVLVAIAGALQKGYALLNENGQLSEVSADDLAAMGPHIVKGLKYQLTQMEENDRFEGLTYEEILEKKEAEKQDGIRKNLEAAGEALKALRGVPEPVELDDGEPFDSAQGDNDSGEPSVMDLLATKRVLEKDLKELDVTSDLFQQKSDELHTVNELLHSLSEPIKPQE